VRLPEDVKPASTNEPGLFLSWRSLESRSISEGVLYKENRKNGRISKT
jgi:hypothetical protein